MTVGTDRKEVLNGLQTGFVREFQRYGKLKDSDIRPTDYLTRQAGTRRRRRIKKYQINN
jgi:hypothetical protein